MSEGNRGVQLPVLEEVRLRSFSLYRVQPDVDIDLTRGIFCLAGANGLGKSSFIATLNYALTGAVSPPSPKLEQLSRYVRDAISYSQTYFNGRIDELDRAQASVSLTFRIGSTRFHIERKFFAPYELEQLAIESVDGETVEHDPSIDAEERLRIFEEKMLRETGLESFQQFIFLQHFVFSFDERRHLLFWDSRATELVLYLAVGLDPQMAKNVDELRKAAAAAGSGARNAQYQAKLAQSEADSLRRSLRADGGVAADIYEQFREMQQERERLSRERNSLRSELAESRLEFAEASAQYMLTRNEYETVFNRAILGGQQKGDTLNQIISTTLHDHKCRVCGTQHADGPTAITSAIDRGECPLCHAELRNESPSSEENTADLVRVDKKLSAASQRSAALSAKVARLDSELRSKQENLGALISSISSFERRHEISEDQLNSEDQEALRARIRMAEGAVDIALGRKEEQLRLRESALSAYAPIQTQLKRAWTAAEAQFVPRFRSLAEAFIGLPLQISMEPSSTISGHAHLKLSVNQTHRSRPEQLSESQRFFLDIALRMSLAQHMTGGESPACLLIDTPEGALDIAYEARAGDMFSTFTAGQDRVVMTANVNTSQLLLRMAERSGHRGMQFVRMTDWTTLTDVQMEEERLFERAFTAIEDALREADIRGSE